MGNAQVDYRLHFLPDLKITVNAGGDYSWSNGDVMVPETAAWTYDPVNGGGTFNTYSQTKRNELLDIYGNYKKELPSISSRFDVTAGYSWQHFWNENIAVNKNFSETRTDKDNSLQPDLTENFLISFFGRFNYVFKNKYFLTATLRRDGSSRFLSG